MHCTLWLQQVQSQSLNIFRSLNSLSLPKPKPSCTGLRWGWLWPTPTPFIEAWTGPSLGSFAHRQDKWRINKLLFGPFLQYQNVTADSGQDRTGLDMARRGEEEPNGTELCERSLCPLAVDFVVVFLLSPHNVVVAGAAASNTPPALLTKLLKRQSIVQSCRSCLTCFKLTDEDEPTCTIYGPCSRWRKPTSPPSLPSARFLLSFSFTWPKSRNPAAGGGKSEAVGAIAMKMAITWHKLLSYEFSVWGEFLVNFRREKKKSTLREGETLLWLEELQGQNYWEISGNLNHIYKIFFLYAKNDLFFFCDLFLIFLCNVP